MVVPSSRYVGSYTLDVFFRIFKDSRDVSAALTAFVRAFSCLPAPLTVQVGSDLAGTLSWHAVGPEFQCCLSGGHGRPAVSSSGLASADHRSRRLLQRLPCQTLVCS